MGLTKVELKGLDDGTDGQIITYDANGNPVAVGPGTDGQVLTSTGAGSPPAFETLPASNNYTHPNHTGDVTSSGDGGTTIADNAVTLAKMAGLARGKIIYGDSSGDPAALTVGSSGTYLTSDGTDISWGSVTSFVTGMIILWSGNVASIPSGWVLCNGSNSTPDLRDKFVIGAKEDDSSVAKTNVTGSLTQSGGAANITIATTNLPSHTHGSGNFSAASGGSHSHSVSAYESNNVGNRKPQNIKSNTGENTTNTSSSGSHSHSLSGTSGSTGDGNAIAVLNPYYALAYIMKS